MSHITETTGARFLVKQIVHYIPGAVVPALVGLATAVIFTRVFNSAQYGQYSLALGITGICATVVSQWLQQGTTRYLPGTTGQTAFQLRQAIVAAIVAISVLGSILLIATGLLLRRWTGPDWTLLLWPGVMTVVTTAVFNPMTSVLQAEMRARVYTRYQIGSVFLRFVLSLLFVLVIHKSIASLMWSGAVGSLLLIPLLWRSTDLPPVGEALLSLGRLRRPIKEMLMYGFPMIGWFFAATLLNLGDRFVIQWARGAADVGIYSANYNMVTRGISLVTTPVLLAAHPFLMQAWSTGDKKETARWLGVISDWFCMIGLVLVACMMLFSRDIALWLLGPDFRSGHFVMPLVFAGELVWQLAMYTHKPLEFANKTGLMFSLGIGVSVLNLLLNWFFVPKFGFGAAAVVTLLCYSLYALITAVISQRYIKWSFSWAQLSITTFLAAAAVVIDHLVRPVLAERFGYWAGLGGSFFVALALMLAVGLRAVRLIFPNALADRAQNRAVK